MNFLKKIWDKITTPFVAVAVILEESRRMNEDGSWDEYWEGKKHDVRNISNR